MKKLFYEYLALVSKHCQHRLKHWHYHAKYFLLQKIKNIFKKNNIRIRNLKKFEKILYFDTKFKQD